MEDEKIEIEVELAFNDFWRTIFWQTIKKTWFIYLIALLISVPALLVLIYALSTNFNNAKFSILLLVPFLPLVAVLISQWGIYSSAKKTFDSVNGKIQYIFSDEGYEIFSTVGKAELNWASLEDIQEKSKEFLLFPQKPIFFILPKRSFTNEQIRAFRNLVKLRLGAKAKLEKQDD